jgi:L-asparaginase
MSERQHEQSFFGGRGATGKKGLVGVRSSRVPAVSVGRDMEVNDHQMGFVASDELNPQKARILLMLALLRPRSTAEIQQLFLNY